MNLLEDLFHRGPVTGLQLRMKDFLNSFAAFAFENLDFKSTEAKILDLMIDDSWLLPILLRLKFGDFLIFPS